MKLGTRIIDTRNPSRTGVFQGWHTQCGTTVALVRWEDRNRPTTTAVRFIARTHRAETFRQRLAVKQRRREAAALKMLDDAELARRAELVGLSVEEAREALGLCGACRKCG